ncbi:endoplasmic reticulum aminopeptidase 1 [Eublepharis macularius]|uniref:Aminopeptidase n=1 Tax=Eublepharis macularius TaxID=481883 RepID=A0AA97JQM1_EUBMA|nr:endoplasmic reticulum aminopeptidase 1 [Eublepharis macularius]XP_054842437.1 endoplasmic reticulum aminopeptidase 1 [Eublepharis macularius]XP_054842438.1 endoplasmic reticulum aminopeptidase 1 [Eublepharis macularius]
MVKIFLLLGILNLAIPLSCDHHNETGYSSKPFPWNKMRLPKHVVPVHYDLLIHPNLTTLTFTGFAKIEISVLQQTSSIILHSKYLHISKAAIQGEMEGINTKQGVTVSEYPPFEQIALLTGEALQAGNNYFIIIEYFANLSDNFHGFYKSTYRTPEGEERVLALTQFEPTAARMAFPCFDEPAFKARFSVKIRREQKHHGLSNMPLVKSINIMEWLIEDHFEMSVKMSTYLVAFMVSDFKSITKMTSRGIKVSIYTVPYKINQAYYALDSAVKLLDFYEGYFSIPYPLPKQDLAAIPDFQSGAMENWGLTTYRESSLLYDPEKSSASSRLGITMVIAHELAHQWFGNLVTMEWWNDLWLNEGFAKFMEYVSVNITHPELGVEDYFLDKYFNAMEVDALNSSHPISTAVEDPAQILEMFDEVSYDKGSCILSMLREYLGSTVFEAGIVKYLLRFSYQNTQSEDLWNSLSEICPAGSADESQAEDGVCARSQEAISSSHWTKSALHDVKTMMNTWTLQKGFPLVTVTVRGKNIHLQQEHYMKGSHLSSPTGYLWHIPLTYITSKSDIVQRFLLRTKTDSFILPEEVEWIKFNVGMNGYYIVHYGDDGWDALISLLKENHNAISSNDRASLINSVFQLVSAEKLCITKALDLTLYLQHESKVNPVSQGLSELVPIYKLLEKRDMSDTADQLKGYLVNLFKNIIDKQSWTDEGSMAERILRSTLLTFACVRKYQPCVDKAMEYFMKWKDSDGTLHLPSDIKLAVYAVGAQTDEGWDFLFSKYQLPKFNTEKGQIEVVLTLSCNKEKLQWIMDQALQGDTIKTQDLPHIVVSVGRNPDGYQLAWKFLKENWPKLVQKFELGSHSLANMITGVTNKYSTKGQLEEVKDFFSALDKKSSQLRSVEQAIETIEENIQWMHKNLEKIQKWLQTNSKV